jgi:hypothetical protein
VKHIVKGFVHYSKEDWEDRATYEVYPFDMSAHGGRALIGEQQFEIDVPDDFNPIPQMVAALEEQKRVKRLKLAEDLANLDAQISRLTCIENSTPGVEF